MLLQSKNPQPRPNNIRNATATHSCPVCGDQATPNIAGMIIPTPSALVFDPSGARLYVAHGTQNAVGVYEFDPDDRARGPVRGRASSQSRLLGLVPVGWFPGALAHRGTLSAAGSVRTSPTTAASRRSKPARASRAIGGEISTPTTCAPWLAAHCRMRVLRASSHKSVFSSRQPASVGSAWRSNRTSLSR